MVYAANSTIEVFNLPCSKKTRIFFKRIIKHEMLAKNLSYM